MFHIWNNRAVEDLNDLRYFARVVEHGGFAPAGRAMQVPKSKLSRRIAALEERLGVRLIQRSTRRFSVTELGQIYYRHCKAMLVEAEAAQEAIALHRAEPRGTIRLTCPVALLHALVSDMLAEFMAAYPRVDVLLEATNRRVDVVAEGIDVALRVRYPPLEDSDLHLRVLAERSQCLVVSPALLERFGPLRAPAELSRLPSLDLETTQPHHSWQLIGPNGQAAKIHHRPRLVTDDMVALRKAANAGVGVVQLPTIFLLDELRDGTLVRPLPEWAPRRHIIHAVYPSRRGLLPAVRALLDHLAARFAEIEEQ